MTSLVDAVGSAALAALIVWYVGGLLLRLAATSCFACAAGLLALGDLTSTAGVTGCGLVCWVLGQLLCRARHGHWKTPRAAALLGRDQPIAGHRGAARRPG